MLDLAADSPFRPVDWRWQKAMLLYDTQQLPSRRRDDEMIARARRYIIAQNSIDPNNKLAVLRLQEHWTHLANAYEIRVRQNSTRRAELEARLLTKAPIEAIAKKIYLSLDSVRWYEALFFNVKDRLNEHSWISENVLGQTTC